MRNERDELETELKEWELKDEEDWLNNCDDNCEDEGPFGGAFSSWADFWSWKEG